MTGYLLMAIILFTLHLASICSVKLMTNKSNKSVKIMTIMKKLNLLLVLTLVATMAFSQTYDSRLSESKMTISGTSTLHDWESVVENFSATVSMKEGDVMSATFEGKVKSIKSGTGSMDDNTYEAMSADKYPTISFKSKEITTEGNNMVVQGTLTIAGKSQTIKMILTKEQWSEKSLKVSGSHTMKMSEYGINPPRAMFGTIRTGDEVTIKFDLTLYK